MNRIIFALVCTTCIFQAVVALPDAFEHFIGSQILALIKNENLSCTNYKEFCERGLEQFQNSVYVTAKDANEMATQFCLVLLKAYLCTNIAEDQ